MFGNRNKRRASDERTIDIEVSNPGNPQGWFHMDDDDLARLNARDYDRINISVNNSNYVLENLCPHNPMAEVHIYGGNHHLLMNNTIARVTSHAAQKVEFSKPETNTILTVAKAPSVEIREGSSENIVTLYAPETENLRLRDCAAQLGADMPRLKSIDGGEVTGFANPFVIQNVAKYTKQIGGTFIAPLLQEDEWSKSFMVYNRTTKNFIVGGKTAPLPELYENEKLVEAMNTLCDILTKDIPNPNKKCKAVQMATGFVSAIARIEAKERGIPFGRPHPAPLVG